MSRSEITKRISTALEHYLNPYGDPRIYVAKEVTFDYGSENTVRVDYMLFRPENNTPGGIEQGLFYCYEVKSCKEDLLSGHGTNFLGDFNYLVMDKGMYEKLSGYIPYAVGVFELCDGGLVCVKKAKKTTRKRPVTEMLLMMFRSANRENIKRRKVCGNCSHFLGGGDWNLCCNLSPDLFYSNTPACDKFEPNN